jgi:hypothetical protein
VNLPVAVFILELNECLHVHFFEEEANSVEALLELFWIKPSGSITVHLHENLPQVVECDTALLLGYE